ncbi:hypothetical protein ACLKMH_06235 [Psychromonas sp. KJ10-10]|uniref:hypothetical protein n=1 Tax=Psychromonas sp. KJ10-10 TaxID=3391823 RepID=UPI0039B63EBF
MNNQQTHKPLSGGLLFLMAMAISATAANLYYNQPLLPSIGEALGIEDHNLGLIPSSTQIGYAQLLSFLFHLLVTDMTEKC